MKEYFLCRILGHKFIGVRDNLIQGQTIYSAIDFCCRCGLSKEEIKEQEKKEWKK